MISRKRWSIALGLLVLVSMIVAACAPAAAPTAAPPDEEEGRALPADAADDQTLHWVSEGGCGRGPFPGIDFGGPCAIGTPFLTGFLMDTEGNLLPGLFTDYDVNDDNTVFSFHIDPRAVWSDGKSVTAQDFVDWYNFIFNPDRADWPRTYNFGPVAGMDEYADGETDTWEGFQAIDDKTLEITLSFSQGWFPSRMAWRWSAPARVDQFQFILDGDYETAQDQWGAMGDMFFRGANAADLIVSGPFKPTWLNPEPDALYTFERNPMWWREDVPYLTGGEGTTIRDFQTMLLMFENGEIDVALNLSGPPAVLLRNERPEVFRQKPSFGFAAQWMDVEKEPMDDINLRKALLYSIEWEKVADVAWEGQFPAMNGGTILTPNMLCFDPDYKPYAFDPEKALEYLAQSKYGPTGETVPKIRVFTGGSDPSRIRAAQIIQEMWRVNLGIEDVEIKNVEAEFVDGEGLVGMRVSSSGAALPIPALVFEGVAHSRAGGAQNFSHWSNPDLDAKIDALLAKDPTEAGYCDEAQEIHEAIMDAAIVMPTAHWLSFYQVQNWLSGFNTSPSDWYTLFNTYRTK